MARGAEIHDAAIEGDLFTVARLVDSDHDLLNSRDSRGWTPLHVACLYGQEDIASLLLKYGADIEARDDLERTPLILTAEGKDAGTASLLIKNGADINATAIRGYTAILWGARNRFTDYVDLLISRRALIAPEDRAWAFQLAVVTGMEGLFDYVIELGCDIEQVKQEDPGLIFPAAGSGSLHIVRKLLEAGFVSDQTDDDGWSVIHYAASEGQTEVIQLLLESGGDIDVRNLRGESAYDLAVLKGFEETAVYLALIGAATGGPVFPSLHGPYMGQSPPGDTPVLFCPGIVSAHDRAHSSITFSPDATEAYWTEMIPPEGRVAYMRLGPDGWSYPVKAPVDRDPTFSPDGKRLYFIKTRPYMPGEARGGDSELREEYWYMERTEGGWSEPVSTGDSVNSVAVHWPCSVDRDGNLYFSEFSRNMYCSQLTDGVYGQPVNLGELLGRPELDGRSPFMSPDGDYLLYCTDSGMHVVFKKTDGSWTGGIHLGDTINASHENGSPRVTADGKYLFFLSAGKGRRWGIYWVSTDFLQRLRAESDLEQ